MKWFSILLLASMALISCGKKQVPPESELFAQATKYNSTQEFNKEVEAYQQIVDNYPTSDRCYKALFMIAFIQMEELKNPRKAISPLEQLLTRFPNCDLANDATHMLAVARSGNDLMGAFNDSLKTK